MHLNLGTLTVVSLTLIYNKEVSVIILMWLLQLHDSNNSSNFFLFGLVFVFVFVCLFNASHFCYVSLNIDAWKAKIYSKELTFSWTKITQQQNSP